MATKHSQPRSLYGTAKAHGDAQAQATRLALAEAGQGPQARGGEEAEGDVGLKRLITEPGETWILETDEDPETVDAALRPWYLTRQVMVLVFGPQERFTLLATQPGDVLLLHTPHPEALNLGALGAWAESRGLKLAVLPPEMTLEHVDDATLDRMNLMRKPGGIIIPAFGQNGSPA